MNLLYISLMLGVAFLLQSLLGFMQIKNFAKVYSKMAKKGKVLIGKNPKTFKAGTVILLNIDKDANIKDAKIMSGITVFAKFKDLSSLKGENLVMLASDYQKINRYSKLTKECLLNAYRNYVNYKTGQLSRTDLDTSTNFLSLPIFSMWKNELVYKFNQFKQRRKL